MANSDTPMGFKPVRYQNGAAYTGKARVCYVPATNNTRIGLYDLVSPAGSADASGKYMTVARAAATETDILGSVVGFGETPYMAFDPDDLGQNYLPTATAGYVWVADDPDLLFVCQDDASATLTADDIGLNADIVVADCSTTTGLSAMEISATGATNGTAQIRIEGLYDDPNNSLGDNALWLVRINEHAYKNTAGA
jgi:hypothetical protein